MLQSVVMQEKPTTRMRTMMDPQTLWMCHGLTPAGNYHTDTSSQPPPQWDEQQNQKKKKKKEEKLHGLRTV